MAAGAGLVAIGIAALAYMLTDHPVSTADALTSQQCQNLAVPAYFYPGPGWSRATRTSPVPKIMIMDAAGPGAGSGPVKPYQQAVRQAQAAGITIMGYADTDYARRPVATVETDVRNYKTWYGITSIFLDQVSATAAQLPYYTKVASYIHGKNPGSAVMLNPGTYPDPGYMAVGDIVVVFENTAAAYAGLHVPGWVRRYPAARFAHIIYASPAAQLAGTLTLAAQRHAGYVYITDRAGPGRYAALPGYWNTETAIISRCVADPGAAGGSAAP